MRVLLLVLICCMNVCAFGQVPRSLTDDLNQELKDDLIRGMSYNVGFTVQDDGEIIFQNREDQGLEKVLPKVEIVLKRHTLLEAGSYYLHVYWDLYSSEVYTSIGRSISEGFPNYTNIFSSPGTSYKTFVRRLISDLGEHDFNFSRYSGDTHRLEVYVDEKGVAKFLGLDRILPYLGSVKEIPWIPDLYYGTPAKSIFSIKLVNPSPFSKDTTAIELDYMPEIFVMNELFEQNLVKIQPNNVNQMPRANLVVSFVLNAASGRFENPMIHGGQRDKAATFIDFINKQQPLDIDFYWQDYPTSGRYYFYVNEF